MAKIISTNKISYFKILPFSSHTSLSCQKSWTAGLPFELINVFQPTHDLHSPYLLRYDLSARLFYPGTFLNIPTSRLFVVKDLHLSNGCGGNVCGSLGMLESSLRCIGLRKSCRSINLLSKLLGEIDIIGFRLAYPLHLHWDPLRRMLLSPLLGM